MMSPIQASLLQMVLPKGPSELAENPSPIRLRNQTGPASSTAGCDEQEVGPEVRIDENHPHFFSYETYVAKYPYHRPERTKF